MSDNKSMQEMLRERDAQILAESSADSAPNAGAKAGADARIFENPANGHRETVSALSSLWVLLFGILYLLASGLLVHALLWAVIALISFGAFGEAGTLIVIIMNVVYAIAIPSILRAKYLRKGWRPVSASAPNGQTRPQPTAAEPRQVSDSAPQSSSVADELQKLANLRDQGILTSDEFDAQKAKILG